MAEKSVQVCQILILMVKDLKKKKLFVLCMIIRIFIVMSTLMPIINQLARLPNQNPDLINVSLWWSKPYLKYDFCKTW